MADEAAGDGRGQGAGRGGARKSKFAPTVPARRKKVEEGAAAGAGQPTAADAAAGNEAFSDLIRAAQADAKWTGRGRGGRGFGRGRGAAAPATVVFGGSGEEARRTAAVPQPAQRSKGGEGGVKQEGAGRQRTGRLKPNIKLDGKTAADGSVASSSRAAAAGNAGSDEDSDGPGAQLFDFDQYFPTTLPLSLHHPGDEGADVDEDAALMRQGLPEELALAQDDPETDTAQQLGFTDLTTAQDTIYLFQLPSLLPLGVPKQQHAHQQHAQDASAAGSSRQAAAAAAAAAAGGGGGGLRALGVRELPSGPVGKLLVFKSGRVKLQVGSCLLDVTAGMPCVSRQDVAAINRTTGHLVQLGPVSQRAVVCPDVWQLMADQEVPQFPRQLRHAPAAAAAAADPTAAAAAAANGGPHDTMEVDGADGLEDSLEEGPGDAAAAARHGRKKQQQRRLADSDADDDGSDGNMASPGRADRQQQQQQQQQHAVKGERKQRKAAAQPGSSSGGSDDEVAAGSKPAASRQRKGKQPPPAAAAAASAAADPAAALLAGSQQQQAGNSGLGILDLLATAPAPRSSAGRGRGSKFRPSARAASPAPGAAAAAAAAAAPGATGAAGVKREQRAPDDMHIDS